jgi:hypothetical protein
MPTLLTKPVRRKSPWRAPHGVRPDVVITIYPGAIIGLRELGRRKEVKVSAATIYTRALLLAEVRERKRSRLSWIPSRRGGAR